MWRLGPELDASVVWMTLSAGQDALLQLKLCIQREHGLKRFPITSVWAPKDVARCADLVTRSELGRLHEIAQMVQQWKDGRLAELPPSTYPLSVGELPLSAYPLSDEVIYNEAEIAAIEAEIGG